MMDVSFKSLHVGAVRPRRATHYSAGYDLVAVEDQTIQPGQITTVPLGFATSMPGAIHCRIEARSGLALQGLAVITGVIDADYRGEWKVIMGNLSAEPKTIVAGQRVAQAVFRPTVSVGITEVDELDESERGSGGFGSTGK